MVSLSVAKFCCEPLSHPYSHYSCKLRLCSKAISFPDTVKLCRMHSGNDAQSNVHKTITKHVL